jgi:hypothetical protein
MAKTVSALAQEAEKPGWAEPIQSMATRVQALEAMIGVLICSVIAIALLSCLSIAYLSSRINGVANVPVNPQ